MKVHGKYLKNKVTGELVELDEIHGQMGGEKHKLFTTHHSITYKTKEKMPSSFINYNPDDFEIVELIPKTQDEILAELLR